MIVYEEASMSAETLRKLRLKQDHAIDIMFDRWEKNNTPVDEREKEYTAVIEAFQQEWRDELEKIYQANTNKEGEVMGRNFFSVCHDCREQLMHLRGKEGNTMHRFANNHPKHNVEVLDDYVEEPPENYEDMFDIYKPVTNKEGQDDE